MREIKFRAWYEPDKQTKDGALKFQQAIFQDQLFFTHGLEDDEYCGRLIKYPFEVPFLDDDWTVEQFTGLVDKNGVEIYEGDIVEFSRWGCPKKNIEDYLCQKPKKIVWGLDYGEFPNAGWSAISLRPADLEEGHTLNWMDARNMTIIGNIHENPELLEK